MTAGVRLRPVGARDDPRRRVIELLAPTLLLVDAVLLAFVLALWSLRALPVGELADAYLVGDTAIGTSFAVAGGLVAVRASQNVVGWLMLAGGTCYLVAAAVGTLAFVRVDGGDGGSLSRALVLVFVNVWMPAVALLFPLALQLFPTGRPINRWWKGFAYLTVVAGLVVLTRWVLTTESNAGLGLDDPSPLVPPDRSAWLRSVLDPLQPLSAVLFLGSFLAPLARLFRASREERAQVLWLVWAVLVVVAVNLPFQAASSPPPVPLLTMPLIPAAMTVAVLRYHLYGIQVVVNRTLVYALLTGLLLGLYAGVVVGVGRLAVGGSVPELLAAGAVAVALSPVRARLQRGVDRLMYGSRADPYGALATLGAALATPMTPDEVLRTIAESVARAVRAPSVQVVAGRPGATERAVVHGRPSRAATAMVVPLAHRGEVVGRLDVALPLGRRVDDRTRALLEDLGRQAGAAVHSVVLTDELRESRTRSVMALEEERTRIRRDLHDGLGPVLTGLVLKAEAAGNLASTDAARARGLIGEVGDQARTAIDDVRRLVHGLRPPALDEVGLVEALRRYVRLVAPDAGRPQATIEAPSDPLPPMSEAVEVAAYRIVTEAVTNAVRHAGAGTVSVTVAGGDALRLRVRDDGASPGPWRPGVGLTSMRARATEVGGTLSAGPGADGGEVLAVLPWEAR